MLRFVYVLAGGREDPLRHSNTYANTNPWMHDSNDLVEKLEMQNSMGLHVKSSSETLLMKNREALKKIRPPPAAMKN